MKKRDELLAMAERAIETTKKGTADDIVTILTHIHHAVFSQACVMLAKELREGAPEIVLDEDMNITIETILREQLERAKEGDK